MPKKAQITQERVEYNVFLFDEPPKGFKSLKISKISLTFRFDKLSNLSKSVHTGENSQILTVSNKKKNSKVAVGCLSPRLTCRVNPRRGHSPSPLILDRVAKLPFLSNRVRRLVHCEQKENTQIRAVHF
jgi:hypothetical protein